LSKARDEEERNKLCEQIETLQMRFDYYTSLAQDLEKLDLSSIKKSEETPVATSTSKKENPNLEALPEVTKEEISTLGNQFYEYSESEIRAFLQSRVTKLQQQLDNAPEDKKPLLLLKIKDLQNQMQKVSKDAKEGHKFTLPPDLAELK